MTYPILQQHASDHFRVEVGYHKGLTWSARWEPNTFHDARDTEPVPGRGFRGMIGEFDTFNADVAPQKDGHMDFPIEQLARAIEYAQRLQEHGRWAHAWGNKHNWPKFDRRDERLLVRLVRHRSHLVVTEYPI